MIYQIKNKDDLTNIIQKNDIVLIDFYTDWCGPCKVMLPLLEKIEKNLTNIKFVKVNIEQLTDLGTEFEVTAIPTIAIIKNNKTLVCEPVGPQGESSLIEWINRHVNY